ncbi:hypothetical protein PoB_007187700 [Plakobranchus ocellatus]|uniref:Uncharacterized protein n=1 Tax=Plakobranchus ocellatus TaxID=259542 RepID=A0AAV4DM87_9GAST|nr:hypothetical protein PoB_007187700 [Plakobranchus ocellatus]
MPLPGLLTLQLAKTYFEGGFKSLHQATAHSVVGRHRLVFDSHEVANFLRPIGHELRSLVAQHPFGTPTGYRNPPPPQPPSRQQSSKRELPSGIVHGNQDESVPSITWCIDGADAINCLIVSIRGTCSRVTLGTISSSSHK